MISTTPPKPPTMWHVNILLDYIDACHRRHAAEAAQPVAVEVAAVEAVMA